MKKLLLLLMFPLLLSCSDDEPEPFDITPLIGKWKQTYFEPLSFGNYYFEFYEDHTLTHKVIGYPDTITNYNREKFKVKDNAIYMPYSTVPSWRFEVIDADNIRIYSNSVDPFDKYSLYHRLK